MSNSAVITSPRNWMLCFTPSHRQVSLPLWQVFGTFQRTCPDRPAVANRAPLPGSCTITADQFLRARPITRSRLKERVDWRGERKKEKKTSKKQSKQELSLSPVWARRFCVRLPVLRVLPTRRRDTRDHVIHALEGSGGRKRHVVEC